MGYPIESPIYLKRKDGSKNCNLSFHWVTMWANGDIEEQSSLGGPNDARGEWFIVEHNPNPLRTWRADLPLHFNSYYVLCDTDPVLRKTRSHRRLHITTEGLYELFDVTTGEDTYE